MERIIAVDVEACSAATARQDNLSCLHIKPLFSRCTSAMRGALAAQANAPAAL